MAAYEKVRQKEKNQNIQVFVRLRPLNQRERSIRSHCVVDVSNNREVVVRQSHQSSHTKRFTFDRAFGPDVKQVEVYKEVVNPLIAEVLAGYNCTVFAYGQTGTGKTHTMVGESSGDGCTWQNDPLAGMIPRALSHLFDELRISNAEYNVRVSYLELYNEELFDLLSSSVDNSKLRIYEDVTRKGSTIVNGLEEITVYNKNEVYDIMARGQERKKVASTLMNSQSSRSHTVFTIVVHIKENSPKGEELVKIGKLNLVDLAGSENISKAGSDNPAKKERARECVNINQSLLTLGRVITALVEKHPHIPYRESKLTRILQESLGGRTKTSIIATISPGHKDLEETMSTLEYANRAKNIQNKPEVNQKLTKQAILKEFAEEVDKLKRELIATREKNGVYLPTDTYEEMTAKHNEQRLEIQALLLKKRALEDEKARVEEVFRDMELQHERAQAELQRTREELDATHMKLTMTEQERAEQQCLVERHVQTEGQLTVQAQQLLAAADGASDDAAHLHEAVDRRRSVENANSSAVAEFRAQSADARRKVLDGALACRDLVAEQQQQLQAAIDDQARDTCMTQEMTIHDIQLLVQRMAMFAAEIKSLASDTSTRVEQSATQSSQQAAAAQHERQGALQAALTALLKGVASSVQAAEGQDVAGAVQRATTQWLSGATARVSCLSQSQASFVSLARTSTADRASCSRSHHSLRMKQLAESQQLISASIAKMEQDKKAMEERLSQQITTIEAERAETERRLQTIVQEVETVRSAVNNSAEQHKNDIESQRQAYVETTEQCLQLQRQQLEALNCETEFENEHLDVCERDNAKALENVEEFDKEFGEGAFAINAEMEAFSQSVVHIVDHTSGLLLDELRGAKTTIEASVEQTLKTDAEITQQCLSTCDAAVREVAQQATTALYTAVTKTEETSTSVTEALSGVSARASRLAYSAQTAQQAQSETLCEVGQGVRLAVDGVREGLEQHQDLEGRYLLQEYRVYAPSGNTPLRREFRYPRRLVATSPHERILARFRAQQRNNATVSPDSDCVVVESDENRHSSDSDADEVSESSVSEDSAVAMQ